MRKILAITCLVAGCVCGMEVPVETKATTSVDMTSFQNTDRSVKLDLSNSEFMNQWQSVLQNGESSDTDDNIFETTKSAYIEGRFWTIVRKVFQPVQIVTSASTMVLIAASEMVKETHESVSTGLSYGALGSAVASGVLSLFISKMNNKIHSLNRTYKAKLAAEHKSILESVITDPGPSELVGAVPQPVHSQTPNKLTGNTETDEWVGTAAETI